MIYLAIGVRVLAEERLPWGTSSPLNSFLAPIHDSAFKIASETEILQ
jgi:hypothetical protein